MLYSPMAYVETTSMTNIGIPFAIINLFRSTIVSINSADVPGSTFEQEGAMSYPGVPCLALS
jgi:hypothetical protein